MNGAVAQPGHRFREVADASCLGSTEMPEIVDVNAFAANAFQRGIEVLTEHFVVEVAASARRREQQCFGIVGDMGSHVVLEVCPDMRGHHNGPTFTRLRRGHMAAAADMCYPTADRDDLTRFVAIFAAKLKHFSTPQATPGRDQNERPETIGLDRIGELGDFIHAEDYRLVLALGLHRPLDLAWIRRDQPVGDGGGQDRVQ